MSALHDLAGRLRLRPGTGGPTIASSRPDAAALLAPGRPAAELPALMASLFTLCGGAHRLASRLALAAAQGRAEPAGGQEILSLRLDTAREQLLRIGHDWPRQLPGAAAFGLADLRECPPWRAHLAPAARLAALPGWLAQHWLGLALPDWLSRYQADPGRWPLAWCAQVATPLAKMLHAQAPAALALRADGPGLDLLSQAPITMPMLARQMAGTPLFCRQPTWQGQVPDTGPWTRHHDPLRGSADNAWMRLLSRLIDLLRLAAPDGGHWLAQGSLALGPAEGIAWVEMARGLLLHWVRLDSHASPPRVAEYRVLAPTEWNFHPEGVLARALQRLQGAAIDDDTRRLTTTFDPCVPFEIEHALSPHHGLAHA